MILAKKAFAKHCIWKVLQHAVLYLGVFLSWSLMFLADASAQQFPIGAFVTTWETRTNNESIIIPTTGTGYNYAVDCGADASPRMHANQTGNATCTYANPGMHTVIITGAFPRIFFNGGTGKNKIRSVAQWGNQVWTSMGSAFRAVGPNMANSFDITATDAPDLSIVTSMANMFDSAATFTGTNTDMSKWVVSNVTTLARTFYRASAFNGDIGNWNVGKVKTLFHTFEEASVFNQDISGWRPGSDANTVFNSLSHTFNGAAEFDQDFGNWDVSRVTNFDNTFTGTALSTANYEALLIGWAAQDLVDTKIFNVGNVQYCSRASTAARLSIIFDDSWKIMDGGRCAGAQEFPAGAFVTTWETRSNNETITIPTEGGGYNYNVDCDNNDANELIAQTGDTTCTYASPGTHTIVVTGDFPRIFFNGVGDKNKIRSVAQWGTQRWTSMERAFRAVGPNTANSFDITATDAPDLTHVTSMANMFDSAATFTGANTDMSRWVVSNVQDMARTFSGASAFNGNIRNWDVGKVTNLFYTFSRASVFNHDISGWRPGSDTNTVFNSLRNTFDGAVRFNQNLGNWDVSRVTNFDNTFTGTALSTANYEALLIGWAAQDLVDSRTFNVGSVQYCSIEALLAKAAIISDDSWTIIDGGTSSCPAQSPFITSSATISVMENQLLVTTVEASDADGDTITYSLSGGAHQNLFTIDSASGVLTFKIAPTIAATPASNEYTVMVTASDGSLSDTQTLTIRVTEALSITDAFVTTWETRSNNESITIPTTGTGYNYNVDCDGDGTNDFTAQTGDTTCTYATSGMQTVVITGAFPRIFFDGGAGKNKIRSVAQWGNQVWTSMERAFRAVGPNTANSFDITATDAPDLTRVTSMANMFDSAATFTGTNTDMSKWVVSNVQILARTFYRASAFNGDIGNWDVGKVTSLFHTFEDAGAFNQDISGWQFDALTNLNSTFTNASSFDQNIGGWNVSRVSNFNNMFTGTALSTANYERLLIGWAAQNLINARPFSVGTVQYCSFASAVARASIISDDEWMITDGGRCTQPTITASTSDAIKTVTVAVGIQTSGVTVTATSYSLSDHGAIIAAADTTDPEALKKISLQPKPGLIVAGVNLLEEAVVDITISDSAACTVAAPCEVTLPYTATDLGTLGITDPTDLSIFHYTGSQWEELVSIVTPRAMTVTAITSSFSPFALATVIADDDTVPRFEIRSGDTIPHRTYQLNTEITALTLPKATGGNLGLNYSLAPLPPGLSFDASTRTLSGTPNTEGTYPQTYTAADGDANTDFRDIATLTFVITVELRDLTSERVKQLNEAIMPRLTQAMLASAMTAVSSRTDRAFSGAPQREGGGGSSYQLDGIRLNSQSTLPSTLQGALQKLPIYVRSLEADAMDWRQMLANSYFALSLDDNNNSGTNTGISLWGSSDYSQLSGKDNDLDWDGEVFSIQLGADKRIRDNLLLGGLLSWSDGAVDLDIADLADEGSYQHQMTSIHPYMAWSDNDINLWASLGYGQGELKIELGRNKLSTDTSLFALAAGYKGCLSQILSLKTDISLARTDIDKTTHSAEQGINSKRLRLLLEMQRQHDMVSGGFLTSMLEVGLRYDGGDGDSGLGALVDAVVGYTYPATGLTLEGRLHTLAGQDDYTEWGLSVLIALTTAADGRGLAFSLSPSYGMGGGGGERCPGNMATKPDR